MAQAALIPPANATTAAGLSVAMRGVSPQQHTGPCRAGQLQAACFGLVRMQHRRQRLMVITAALKLRPSSSKGSTDGERSPQSQTVKMRKATAQPPAGTTKHRHGSKKQAVRQKQREQQHAADDSSTGRWYSLVTGFPFPASSGCLTCMCTLLPATPCQSRTAICS